jgi:ring-1,2-phenylacetyl-CoA epoxidase subunit PaaE
MNTFHTLTVKHIIKETAHAVSVVFDIPETLKSNFTFKAGQYITLKHEVNGEEVRRAYSICASPNSGELKVAIKAVEGGTFSVYATEHLNEGDTIEVHEPEGNFILEPESGKNYIAFAAGSGITPVLSMVKTVLEDTTDATMTLVYGNKSEDDTIFRSEIESLREGSDGRLRVHYVFSRQNVAGSLFGRIDEGFTNYFVKNIYKETEFEQAFLCGPEDMINTVSNTLERGGFDTSKILFELFTSSSEEDTSEITDGETSVTVLLDDEEISFTMKQTDDLLSSALRNQVDAPYSCQGGICSSCMAKVTEGKAIMTKNSILTDSEVADGFILTCQAHPVTSKIYIDYDDV